jgi:uncharacterized protein (TIGR02145 family)
VSSNCGSSSFASDVFAVTITDYRTTPDYTGGGSLTGKTCFDIGYSNSGKICGALGTASRTNKYVFSTNPTQVYTFNPVGNVENITFDYQNMDAVSVIESISSHSLITNQVTVTFNKELDTQAQGHTRTNAYRATLYVLFNAVGNSTRYKLSLPLSVADCSCCGAYVAKNTWKSFLCHNLGADEAADPFTPSWQINGAYYQWGRKDQAASAPNSDGNDATAIAWNAKTPSGYFGTTAANSTVKTSYDPCPSGYRVPSYDEWNGVITNNTRTVVGSLASASASTWSGSKFGDNLFLPATGCRGTSDGTLPNRGSYGYYWSTRQISSTLAYSMYFVSGSTSMHNNNRTYGFSVRCIVE